MDADGFAYGIGVRAVILHNARSALPWLEKQLGLKWSEPAATVSNTVDDRLVAVAAFHRWSHPDIQITFAVTAKNWGGPDYVRAVFRYPFLQLGCKRITAVTEASNQRARAFLCRLKFRQEGVHPDAFESGDGISYGLLRADAVRWLTEAGDGKTG